MLLLKRKVNETIWIDDDIVIVVCNIQRGKVTLGINSPIDRLILRGELKTKLTDDQRHDIQRNRKHLADT